MSIFEADSEDGEQTKSPSYRTLLPAPYLESLATMRDTLGFESRLKPSMSTSPLKKHQQMGNTTISATSFSTFRYTLLHTRLSHFPSFASSLKGHGTAVERSYTQAASPEA
jgi:hypothetical protein